MTEKQENILQAALRLFAEIGYSATSTSKVAKEAGVSEGLIFRHYGNKEGLLQAVMEVGEQRVKELYADIITEADPKEMIRRSLEIPFSVKEADYEFWKLLYKLKWELDQHNHEEMEPLIVALTESFRKLKYKEPRLEAEHVVLLMDGAGAAILTGGVNDLESTKKLLLSKYEL